MGRVNGVPLDNSQRAETNCQNRKKRAKNLSKWLVLELDLLELVKWLQL